MGAITGTHQCCSGNPRQWISQEKLLREIIPKKKKIKITTLKE